MKKILILGSTGDIGQAVAKKLLGKQYENYMPVRDMKRGDELYGAFPNAHLESINLADPANVEIYLQEQFSKGIVFDYILFMVGVFKMDDRKDNDKYFFDAPTPQERQKLSIAYHMENNVSTAQTLVDALYKIYGDQLPHTVFVPLSSHAATFAVDDPRRVGEEGYVVSKAALSALARKWKTEGMFADVILEEPALIESRMTIDAIPDVVNDRSISRLQPDEYADQLLQKLNL